MSTTTENTTSETIARAFQYWGTIPALSEHATERNLRQDYRGRWFDADTLRFFGSRNRELVAPGLMVELQTNAPGPDRYTVTAWVVDEDTPGDIEPKLLERFTTRRAAVRFAEEAARIWPTV